MREGLDPGGSLGSLCVSRELRDIGAWAAPFPAPSAEGQGEKLREACESGPYANWVMIQESSRVGTSPTSLQACRSH